MKGFERCAQVKGKSSMGVPGLKSELQYVFVCELLIMSNSL